MVSGLRLLWSPPLCPLRASAIFGPSILSLPPPASSGWPSASRGWPCSPPRSLLALPCVLGGWGFFCCSSSPIRSRGRFPVGLGSSNKMPCHTHQRLSQWLGHAFFVCPRLACRARYLPLGSLAHGLLAGHICLMGTPFSRIWRKCSCEATLGVMWRTAGAVGERSPRP